MSTQSIEWTPIFADHTPGYILGYNATIKGCKRVRMMRTDVRVVGYSGIEWQVKMQDEWCGPALFNGYGVAKNFDEARIVVAKVLDFAVSMAWIPDYRVQA